MKFLLVIKIIIILVLISSTAYCQNTRIYGTVNNTENIPIEYFNGIIRNSIDSSILQGGAFIDGVFEFVNLKPNTYILEISSVGYASFFINCNTNNSIDLNLGTLELNSLTLDEFEIVEKIPIINRKDGNLIINVANSSLNNAGNSIDVLRRSPGVIVDNQDNITVLGKGSPVVFINGKEVVSKEELDLLQSDDIESIEINRNPSAEYSASGHSVIEIRTKKITKDKLNILVSNTATFGRRYSNKIGVKLNSSFKKINNYLSYSYNYTQRSQFIDAYEYNYLPNDTILNKKNENTYYKNKTHNIFYGFDYNINQSNILGFQFSSSIFSNDDTSYTNSVINKQNLPTNREVYKQKKRTNEFYDVNLNYKLNIDSLTNVSIITDYAKKKQLSNSNLLERNKTYTSEYNTKLNNYSLYNIFTGKVDFSKLLFKNLNLKIGAKYSLINNEGSNNTESETDYIDFKAGNNINDQVMATYLSTERKIGKLNLNLGVRYEHTISRTSITETSTDIVNQEYFNLFPSVLLDYEHSDNFGISFSYSERIGRPVFNEINPQVNYFDSLSYSVGNPLIKPTLSHNFELGFNLYSNLFISVGYTKEIDKIVLMAIQDENTPYIIKYTHQNINNSQSFSINISYDLNKKFFTNYSYLGIDKPYTEIPYLNEIRILQKPIFYFQTSNEFLIRKKATLFIDFSYESDGESDITYWGKNYYISGGIYAKFFNKKLYIGVSVDDIFKTYTNSWYDKYFTIESGQTTNPDSRRINLTVKYNFNKFSSYFKEQSSNKEDLNRL